MSTEAQRAAKRRYKQTEKGKAARQRYLRSEARRQQRAAYKARHAEKVKARAKVSNAIRDGKLVRGVCESCRSEHVEAHHDDYSKPLEVRWFCADHHREVENGSVS